MKLGLNQSSSIKYVKSLIGKTNHNLLTILISLDNAENIKEEQILIKDYALGQWSPNYHTYKSFPHAKVFISNATLAWTLDSLDAYYRIINTSPKLIQEKTLVDKICGAHGAQQSIARSHKVIISHFNSLSRFDCCILSLAITWRNNIVHHVAENEIHADIKEELLNIEKNNQHVFYNLNISKMINNAESRKSPSYNELNAIIRTLIHYVETLDNILILDLDIESYANSIFKNHFFKKYMGGENLILSNYCKKTPKRRKEILKRILMEYGFTDQESTKEINEQHIDNISQLKYKDLFDLLSNGV